MFIILDFLFIWVSYFFAFLLRYEHLPLGKNTISFIFSLPIYSAIYLFVYVLFGLYHSIWRYSDTVEIIRFGFANLLATIITFLFSKYILINLAYFDGHLYANSIYINTFISNMLLSMSLRLSYRVVLALRSMQFRLVNFNRPLDSRKRLLVVGAG